jgi:hypothetical protein
MKHIKFTVNFLGIALAQMIIAFMFVYFGHPYIGIVVAMVRVEAV